MEWNTVIGKHFVGFCDAELIWKKEELKVKCSHVSNVRFGGGFSLPCIYVSVIPKDGP
jgi:hypothetical protein